MDIDTGSILIRDAIQNAESGLLIGRFGTIECEVLWKEGPKKSAILEQNAGVFPFTEESHTEWCKRYSAAIANADILATGWYAPTAQKEKQILGRLGWHGSEVRLRSLEPYYVSPEKRWSNCLKGRSVCVVTSFAQTAAEQVKKGGEEIWGSLDAESMWPEGIQWHFVQTGYAPCLAQGRGTWSEAAGEVIERWQEAVEYMVEEVLRTGARICVIGCGGLGMIVADELKKRGKICLVLGGATQVFLGIKGQRWERHEFISRLWRPSWVWPAEEETPAGAERVEGACYWRLR